MLSMKGIYVSSGSACTSGDTAPSHVLTAMGLDELTAKSALRLTIGEELTEDDAMYMVGAVKEVVEKLRRTSQVWAHIIKNDNIQRGV